MSKTTEVLVRFTLTTTDVECIRDTVVDELSTALDDLQLLYVVVEDSDSESEYTVEHAVVDPEVLPSTS